MSTLLNHRPVAIAFQCPSKLVAATKCLAIRANIVPRVVANLLHRLSSLLETRRARVRDRP